MSDPKQGQDACPVDHKSREAWLQQGREANSSSSLPPSHPPVATTTRTTTQGDAESCPVDHGAREVWMQQARAAAAGSAPAPSQQPGPSASSSQAQISSASWTSYIPRIPFFSSSSSSSTSPTSTSTPNAQQPPRTAQSLGTDREISTIPRSSLPTEPSTTGAAAATTPGDVPTRPWPRPANMEQETGADAASGNWIYPSEKMFFEAMKRKGHDPRTADMRTVVPIHNAVNERAWAEIKAWEGPWVEGSSCGGPRLHSFSGLSTSLSPRARFNMLLGYQAPFDRHDWVVDRCGKEIEYVIDFYAGRNSSGARDAAGKLSFYLDVRPKLNSWEGVKMRAFRAAGLA
ncbi:Uu.00g069530.m01.CDS01 [Anthostomella pinea]|uniref:Holocytochrome c-type synthase n=1 Tax=Anthostomella pinea TaxID=933095 RepID=A0AAI8YNJ5_9PEZI|nr:Uu.00g069530.m01.CDS01 [Anthostomella pinea]